MKSADSVNVHNPFAFNRALTSLIYARQLVDDSQLGLILLIFNVNSSRYRVMLSVFPISDNTSIPVPNEIWQPSAKRYTELKTKESLRAHHSSL